MQASRPTASIADSAPPVRRANAKRETRRTVDAIALGKRTANSPCPNARTDAACAQYVNGGFVRWIWSRSCGSNQLPCSAIQPLTDA